MVCRWGFAGGGVNEVEVGFRSERSKPITRSNGQVEFIIFVLFDDGPLLGFGDGAVGHGVFVFCSGSDVIRADRRGDL